MVEMMHMMQQLVVGGGQDSSGPNQEGPSLQFENEARPSPDLNQGQTTPPFIPQRGNQEVDPSKDKNLESGYGQVKS